VDDRRCGEKVEEQAAHGDTLLCRRRREAPPAPSPSPEWVLSPGGDLGCFQPRALSRLRVPSTTVEGGLISRRASSPNATLVRLSRGRPGGAPELVGHVSPDWPTVAVTSDFRFTGLGRAARNRGEGGTRRTKHRQKKRRRHAALERFLMSRRHRFPCKNAWPAITETPTAPSRVRKRPLPPSRRLCEGYPGPTEPYPWSGRDWSR